MTRHNLQSHLSWLLNSQHNVPGSATAIPPLASSTIAFGAEPYTLSQFPSQAAESIDSNGDLNNASNGQCAGQCEEFVRPSLPASALHNTQRLEAMGRLQSGSKSNAKPRLLSQVLPEVVQTPKQPPSSRPSTSLSDQYNAAYNRSDAAHSANRKGQVPRAQAHQTFATAGSHQRFPYDKTPSVDLTHDIEPHTSSSSTTEHFGESRALWREDSASRKEPLSRRSKKRKSDDLDFEDELGDIRPPQIFQSSFTAIEAFPEEKIPESTPNRNRLAPSQQYKETSNVNASQGSSRIGNTSEHTGFKLKSSLTNSPSTFRASKSETLSIKAESDAEQTSMPPRKVSKAAVADSEEEYEDAEVQEFIVTPRKPTRRISNDVSPNKDRVGEVKHETSTQKKTLIDKGEETVSTRLHQVLQATNAASPFQRDSPTKFDVSKPVESERILEPTLKNLSPTEKRRVQEFLHLKPQHVQADLSELRRARTAACNAIYESGMAGNDAPPEQQAMLKSVNTKIRLLEPLLRFREDHIRYAQRNIVVKARLLIAIEEEREPPSYLSDMEEHRSVLEKLRDIERCALSLLHQAAPHFFDGVSSALESSSEQSLLARGSETADATLVKATQDHQQHQQFESRTLPQHLSSTTQYVQQTQMPPPDRKVDRRSDFTGIDSRDRTPLRTYTSSPPAKDVNAYFSPTRKLDRKLVQGLSSPRHVIPPPALPELESHADITGDMEGVYEDDNEEVFSTHMGSPTKAMNQDSFDYDEDLYGADEDFDELIGGVQAMGPPVPKLRFDDPFEHRSVFAQTSGNIMRPQTNKGTSDRADASHHAQMQFKWSLDVKTAMKERFHLRGFRHNQLEAINATLGGKDAFVLMPTGGGKSLCYQLPSIIRSGKTRGVTVVISPLLSLMQDQVEHLQKLKIQALLINSEVTAEHRRLVLNALGGPDPQEYVQLLYVTPEMINKSQALVRALGDLHVRQRLARIVIDEAHCVSQWGHDFRPDYKQLGEMRQQFRGVPVMALTATATENVKVDVIHNLGITGCEVFTQSFNRPNLKYEVLAKGTAKSALESIATTINTFYRNQSGIVYCLSRKNCESIAASLAKDFKIKAHHYHAGMEPQDKARVQKMWQAGKYHVIVATIAFGMGIDKADVRFVIHHTIPKSLEGYYQETGRAGRDGKRSGCYLYYGYQDTSALKRMIDDGEGSWEQKERQRKMLRNVIQFCENKSDCRRVQVLHYFNETFNAEDCHGACDNCNSSSTFEIQDFSEYATLAIDLVGKVQKENVTLLHCVDILRGGKSKKITDMEHNHLDEYGAGSHLERGIIERVFYRLLSEDALIEHHKVNKAGFASQYVGLGRNCREFASGRRKVKIQMRMSPNAKSTGSKKPPKYASKGTGVFGARTDYPPSTNVSSPIQAVSRRSAASRSKAAILADNDLEDDEDDDDFVVNDDDEEAFEQAAPMKRPGQHNGRHVPHESFEDSDDEFGPVREAGRPERSKKRDIGPPITIDEKLASLNSIHRDVVENFMHEAKKQSDKIVMDRGLKAQPFSTTILREMAITFPKDIRAMLKIPGIDAEKVELYGKRFLGLIKTTKQSFQAMMEQNEDRPQDPNHMVVINISDEDDMGNSYMDDFDDDGSPRERSTYFPSREVEAWNAQFSQVQPLQNARVSSPTNGPQEPTGHSYKSGGRAGRGGHGASRRRGGPNNYRRKSSSGSNKKTPSGGGKRQASINKSAPKGKGSSGGAGGIGMMPT